MAVLVFMTRISFAIILFPQNCFRTFMHRCIYHLLNGPRLAFIARALLLYAGNNDDVGTISVQLLGQSLERIDDDQVVVNLGKFTRQVRTDIQLCIGNDADATIRSGAGIVRFALRAALGGSLIFVLGDFSRFRISIHIFGVNL